MKKRVFQVGSALLLSTLLTTPAVADSFKSDIFCTFPSGIGKVKIEGRGTVRFRVDGLPPNATFTCDMECELFGAPLEQPCTSDAHGRLDATFKNALDICIGPLAEIEDGAKEIICASGFVSSALLP